MAYSKANAAMANPATTPDRTRAREKLRSFYNIRSPDTLPQRTAVTKDPQQQQHQSSSNNSSSKSKSKHKGLNSASFDPKKYLKHLLLEEPLSGLLRTDNQLVSEIRQIDGDMKTMVYENYSKFISATETIGRMKEDADFMDAEMEKLAQQINSISNHAHAVNAKFAPRNTAIHRLSSEHQLLQRLQFLFDLPDQLSKYISKGQFVDAARVWSRTQPLLDHYRQLGVFEAVEKDGKEIMASVEAAIWRRWREDPGTQISDGAECASLLVLLRPESASMLWREYLEIQGVKHRNLRQVCLESSYEYPVVVLGTENTVAESPLPLLDPDPSGTPLPAIAASLVSGTTSALLQHQHQQEQTNPANAAHPSSTSATCSRISYFNTHYLPIWNSLVVGFVSQFVSPAGSGLLEQVAKTRPQQQNQQTQKQKQKQKQKGDSRDAVPAVDDKDEDGAHDDRTMSLLEATTEGTVVGLLSPLSDAAAAASKINGGVASINAAATDLSRLRVQQGKRDQQQQQQVVVGWQAMSAKELVEAQSVFGEYVKEWCVEYEFIVDSLIQFPGDASATAAAANIKPYLEQLDDLVSCVSEYPILARIGGLDDCVNRVVRSWHQHLIDDALRAIVRDMIERLEYYFDPSIDSVDPVGSANSGGNNPPGLQPSLSARDSVLQRRSSASRHQRNASVKSVGSQASAQLRPGSVMSGSWQNAATALERIQQQHQHHQIGDASSLCAGGGGGSTATPLLNQLGGSPQLQSQPQPQPQPQPPNPRGLAHARAVSSAFEALANSATSLQQQQQQQVGPMSASPSLGSYGLGSGSANNNNNINTDVAGTTVPGSGGGGAGNRMSRASIISSSTTVPRQHSHSAAQSISRAGTFRRAREQRNYSNTFTDILDDDAARSAANTSFPQQQQEQQSLRRSFSAHRPQQLQQQQQQHQQQALRRYRPWLVSSVNRNAPLHVFLADMESWLIQQILERVNPLLEAVVQHYLDIEGSQLLSEGSASTPAETATTTTISKDPVTNAASGGQRRQPLSMQTAARMRQTFIRTLDQSLGEWMSEWIPDSFLYSSLAVPIHGTQRHAEKVLEESPMAQLGMSTISDPVSSLLLARFAVDFELTLTQSIYQLCEHGIAIVPDEPSSANANTNATSTANAVAAGGARGTAGGDASAASSADASLSNLLSATRPDSTAGAADRLYSMTMSMTMAPMARADSMASMASRRGTNRAQAALGLSLTPPHASSGRPARWRSVAEQLVKNFVMTVGQDISSDYLRMQPYGIEDNASGTEAVGVVVMVSDVWLSICRWMKQVEDDTNMLFYDPLFSSTLKALETAAQLGAHPESAGTNNTYPSSPPTFSAKGTKSSALPAHIQSNIDRLFAERVDVFPRTVSPLTSGKILFHLAMQIVKAALEGIRLRPPVLATARQFQQLVVDATFVRSWMLRYAGVAPSLARPSMAADASESRVVHAKSVKMKMKHPSGTGAGSGAKSGQGNSRNSNNGGSSDSADVSSLVAVSEQDIRAIQNLVDDWIQSARACAVVKRMPDQALVDRVVFDAWMSAYFGYDVSG